MERNEVGACQQFVQFGFLDAQIDRTFGGQEGVVGDDLHLQPERPRGDDRADVARPDQPQRLAGDLDSHEAILLPLAGLGRGVGLGQLPGEREDQCNGMFGGCDRIAERGVHDDHAARRGGGDVDIVDPDPGTPDDLQVGRGVEERGGDLGRAMRIASPS